MEETNLITFLWTVPIDNSLQPSFLKCSLQYPHFEPCAWDWCWLSHAWRNSHLLRKTILLCKNGYGINNHLPCTMDRHSVLPFNGRWHGKEVEEDAFHFILAELFYYYLLFFYLIYPPPFFFLFCIWLSLQLLIIFTP